MDDNYEYKYLKYKKKYLKMKKQYGGDFTNEDVLIDLLGKKDKDIKILLGANIVDENAKNYDWDLCLSDGIDWSTKQQIYFPSKQYNDKEGSKVPGQLILNWNDEEQMKILLIYLKGKVIEIVFDWSSSEINFWFGNYKIFIQLLQVNGKLFIEEYYHRSEIVHINEKAFNFSLGIDQYLYNRRGSNKKDSYNKLIRSEGKDNRITTINDIFNFNYETNEFTFNNESIDL